jgi:hypothetical protein
MHRGRVRDADDRALDGLQASDGLSPRLGMCVVQQREALLLQLVRCDLDGVGVRCRGVFGDQTYESLACRGETMTAAAMATYAYDQIDQARTGLGPSRFT